MPSIHDADTLGQRAVYSLPLFVGAGVGLVALVGTFPMFATALRDLTFPLHNIPLSLSVAALLSIAWTLSILAATSLAGMGVERAIDNVSAY